MTLNKKHYAGIALFLAAVAVAWYLHTRPSAAEDIANTQPENLGTQIPPAQDATQSYPNAGVDPTAGVSIGDSPLYLTINRPADPGPVFKLASVPEIKAGEAASAGGACSCNDDDWSDHCGSSVTQQLRFPVPQDLIEESVSNLRSAFMEGGN